MLATKFLIYGALFHCTIFFFNCIGFWAYSTGSDLFLENDSSLFTVLGACVPPHTSQGGVLRSDRYWVGMSSILSICHMYLIVSSLSCNIYLCHWLHTPTHPRVLTRLKTALMKKINYALFLNFKSWVHFLLWHGSPRSSRPPICNAPLA